MDRKPAPGPPGRRTTGTTPDELVRHLREAGAKRVYLSRTDAFRDETIPIVATYPYADEATDGSRGEATRRMLTSVFEATDDRLRFHDREWSLEWRVEPAFDEPRADLSPLYDRTVERKYDDGFNLRTLLFAYEAYRDAIGDSSDRRSPR